MHKTPLNDFQGLQKTSDFLLTGIGSFSNFFQYFSFHGRVIADIDPSSFHSFLLCQKCQPFLIRNHKTNHIGLITKKQHKIEIKTLRKVIYNLLNRTSTHNSKYIFLLCVTASLRSNKTYGPGIKTDI